MPGNDSTQTTPPRDSSESMVGGHQGHVYQDQQQQRATSPIPPSSPSCPHRSPPKTPRFRFTPTTMPNLNITDRERERINNSIEIGADIEIEADIEMEAVSDSTQPRNDMEISWTKTIRGKDCLVIDGKEYDIYRYLYQFRWAILYFHTSKKRTQYFCTS